jgi:hypothetical protein
MMQSSWVLNQQSLRVKVYVMDSTGLQASASNIRSPCGFDTDTLTVTYGQDTSIGNQNTSERWPLSAGGVLVQNNHSIGYDRSFP